METFNVSLTSLLFCLFLIQALLRAPSPLVLILRSSFALGGLATRGLRQPSLKSDVHSTCWFFKQLFFCPHNTRTSHSPSALRRIVGLGMGRGGYWARATRFYLSVCLSLLPPMVYPHSLSRALSLPHFAWRVSAGEPGPKTAFTWKCQFILQGTLVPLSV